MQSTRCRRRSSQGRQAEWRAGARVPEHFAVINNGVGGLEAIMRLMDSPASGSCSACLRWREGRRRWGRWAGCWSWEAPFSVQFSERANNSRSPCSVVWGGMNPFSRWHRDYRLLLYFPYNCNCICERKQNYFQFYICMYIITTTVILHLQRAIFETFDLWDIWSEWWGNMTNNKKTTTKEETKTRTISNTFREHLQRAIPETFDLWDIWSEWWENMTWPNKKTTTKTKTIRLAQSVGLSCSINPD